MKNKKIRKIVNEAIGFIHLMSEGTVSEKEGKRVIKRLQKVKFCNLHFVGNNEALESSRDGVAVGCHTCKHNPHAPFIPEICNKCNPKTLSEWQPN